MSALGTILGYWFRFDPRRKTLHVARWERTERGSLVITAACGAQLIQPRAETVPEGLVIQHTPEAALQVADNAQRRVLCKRCREMFP